MPATFFPDSVGMCMTDELFDIGCVRKMDRNAAENSLRLGAVAADCKRVVIGVDLGTAYSGVAIAFRGDTQNIVFCAPGNTDSTQTKVPTALLRIHDGAKVTWEFGHRAESLYYGKLCEATEGAPVPAQLFKGFKMLLHGKDAGYESIMALSMCGKAHSLMELVTEALRVLKVTAMERVALGPVQGVEATKDVQWVLTVPAIWNHFGKAFMRKAALKAGLIDHELSDNLILALEPEGAALAVHAGTTAFSLQDVGSRFMVFDSGGGTVDITVHEVASASPLKLKSIAVPSGGRWGGNNVNLEFQKFLKELLGERLFREAELPLNFYEVYCAFDKAKTMFDPKDDSTNVSVRDLLEQKDQLIALAESYNFTHPDTPIVPNKAVMRNGFLPMSKALMLSFFEPVLEASVQQIRDVLATTPSVDAIIIVGGFGASAVVTARITSEFAASGLRVILSPRPQCAVVQGAVLFGLYKNIIDSRLSQYTYGIATMSVARSNAFHILVRRGQELPVDHTVEIAGMPSSAAQNLLTWRVFRSNLDEPISVLNEPQLGTVRVPCPPHANSAMREQKARFKFGGSEIKVIIETATGEIYQANIQIS